MGAWINSLDPVNNDVHNVWTTFIQEFNDHFADSQLQQQARLELDQCKMCFPDIDQYISDFEDLVRQAGYTVSNEETIGFFLNGLSPSILEEVIRDPFPQNYNEYKVKAVNITKGRQMIELIRARQESPIQEDSTTHLDKIRINSDHEHGEDDPNRTNKGHSSSSSSKDQPIILPLPLAQHTTMFKCQWTCCEPEHHTIGDNTKSTTPTPMPPSCNPNTTTWQTLQDNRIINNNNLKDLVSIVERWDTSPKTVAATP
jgi:Retrotransposon gag protein